jgi:hypothetical protein
LTVLIVRRAELDDDPFTSAELDGPLTRPLYSSVAYGQDRNFRHSTHLRPTFPSSVLHPLNHTVIVAYMPAKSSRSRTKRKTPLMALIETEVNEPSNVEALRRQLVESRAQTATLQTVLDERTEIDYDRLAAAMQNLQPRTDATDRTTTRSLSAVPSESSRWSPKQPDPPLLSDGKDPTFTSWSILLRAKLRDNDDHFPSENSKLTYVYGRTTGAAQAYLEPRFEYGASNPFYTVDEVMAHLAAIYQNPLRRAIAQDQYYDLRQGRTEPFSEFLTKFQHLVGIRGVSLAN